MTPLLLTALFPETGPAELAELALELGFEGLDLAVRGAGPAEVERTIGLVAAGGLPARMLSVETSQPGELSDWLKLAGDQGLAAVRVPPLAVEPDELPARLDALATLAAGAQTSLLVPHHPGSAVADVAALAEALGTRPPLAGALLPDYVARSRAGDHAAWLARLALPPLGLVVVAGYRWDSEIGAGNLRLWNPRVAHLLHGLTPWLAWLQRLAETDFDGLFSFGDASLTATLGERLRTVRDDLRVVRRLWRGGERAHGDD